MAGDFIDAPAPSAKTGAFIDAPAPSKNLLQKAGDVAGGAWRGVQAARTAAARDPVGALGNILGAPERAVAGAVMGPLTDLPPTDNDLGHSLAAGAKGAWKGVTNPSEGNRYNQAFGEMAFHGIRPQGESMPARIGRGAEDFALQTIADPVTHGGAQAAKAIGSLAGQAGKAIGDIPAVGKYAADVKAAVNNPAFKPAVGLVSKTIKTATAPVRGLVNAGKDVLFLNPAPHGVGNMGTLNFLKNGLGTTAKGFKYGVTGTPKATKDTLERIGAGAFSPELMGEKASPWGPVGWAERLPGPTVAKAALGATAGGAVGNKTSPDTDTPQQRLMRTLEGAAIGGVVGGAPALRTGSNRMMERLETGHRGAMLEDLPQVAEAAAKKPHFTAAEVSRMLKRKTPPEIHGPATMNTNAFAIPASKTGRIKNWPTAGFPEPKVDPRAALINEAFGGGKKGPLATAASAIGGPFAQWQGEIVPRAVGGALAKHPARVEAIARAQDITNRDVLKDQPYKLQTGGPVGDMSELLFNTPKYAQRLAGPLAQIDPNSISKPDSLSLGDQLKGASYNTLPGRSVVGPFFGDTMYPSKAPAIPNAALGAVLGWHFANKAPKQDQVLEIMKTTGLDQYQASNLLKRYAR